MDITNKLFLKSFNKNKWPNQDKINLLLSSLDQIENSILDYLKGITQDFPNLTDHSLTHSRMLWNYAEIIIGDLNFLNPMEAFSLHVSFLIHDAGMCYSILDNKKEIEADPLYQDFISRKGDTSENRKDALFYTVRQRHGDFALRVATEKLRDGEYLISNIDLREELSTLIGKIAKSHTCNINYIENEFGGKYTTPKFPIDWTIDCQKLSYILRTADAAHLDNLRTPKTLKMISEIPGVSKEHWTFQKKLGFPELDEDGQLVYTTNNPFKPEEQKAWWFCYDALQMLNKELKSANEYFTARYQKGFAAIGVKSINDTLHLGKKYIRTKDWLSIDTRIQVSNPVHIASELGGVKLYGHKNRAVRELIQNSIDAINLYRVISGQPNLGVGEIKVSLIQGEDEEYYLIVTDTGIGMSPIVMSSELLDFGGSYWKSDRFQKEFQGVKAKGFESIGRFGIGFFATFMMGSEVQVTSWRFGQSIKEMITLDFFDGLNSSPILRQPFQEEAERVKDRGTSVKIKLKDNPFSKDGIIAEGFEKQSIISLVKYFVPSANVRIRVTEIDGEESIIEPCSVEKMDVKSLISHVYLQKKDRYTKIIDQYKSFDLPLFKLENDNEEFGKLTLLPSIGRVSLSSTLIVISNGIRVFDQLHDFAGYIYTSEMVSIKRDSYQKNIPYSVVYDYALNQKKFIEERKLQHLFGMRYLNLLLSFDFIDDSFPLLHVKRNGNYSVLAISQFKEFLNGNDHFRLYQEGSILSARKQNCDGFIQMYYSNPFKQFTKEDDHDKLLDYEDLIKRIVSKVWGEFNVISEPARDFEDLRMDYAYNSINLYKKV